MSKLPCDNEKSAVTHCADKTNEKGWVINASSVINKAFGHTKQAGENPAVVENI